VASHEYNSGRQLGLVDTNREVGLGFGVVDASGEAGVVVGCRLHEWRSRVCLIHANGGAE